MTTVLKSIPSPNDIADLLVETGKTVFIYHHNDNDGWVGATCIYDGIIRALTGRTEPVKAPRVVFQALDYGPKQMEPVVDTLLDDQIAIMVDFSLNLAGMEMLTTRSDTFFCLDHHDGVSSEVKNLGEMYFDNSRSGARLAFDWSLSCLHTPSKVTVPLFIKYVDDRDLWRNACLERDGLASRLDYVIRNFKNTSNPEEATSDIISHIRELIFAPDDVVMDYANVGRYAVERTLADAKSAVKHAGKTKLFGRPARFLFSQSNDSDIGEALYMDSPDCIAMVVSVKNGSNVKVSLRSSKQLEDVHLGQLAATYFGGGGHKHAAGFMIPLDRLSSLVSGGFKFAAGISPGSFVVAAESPFTGYYREKLIGALYMAGNIQLRDRHYCETDSSFLQLLPYITVKDQSGNTLTYRRPYAGDEPALHAMHSIGFGGHVDDLPLPGETPLMWLVRNAVRELMEELNFDLQAVFKDAFAPTPSFEDGPCSNEIRAVIEKNLTAQLTNSLMYLQNFKIINKRQGVDKFHLGLSTSVVIPRHWLSLSDNSEAEGTAWMSESDLLHSTEKGEEDSPNTFARKWESWSESLILSSRGREIITD